MITWLVQPAEFRECITRGNPADGHNGNATNELTRHLGLISSQVSLVVAVGPTITGRALPGSIPVFVWVLSRRVVFYGISVQNAQ